MKSQVIGDQDFEAMLNALRVTKPELHCKQGNLVNRLCINPECAVSLMCNIDQCKSCGSNVHEFCSSMLIDSLTGLLNKKVDKYREFINNTLEAENQFISQIYRARKDVIAGYRFGDLPQKYQTIIKNIFQNKDSQTLNGKDAEELINKLKRDKGRDSKHASELLQNFKANLQSLRNQIGMMKENLFENFFLCETKKKLKPKIEEESMLKMKEDRQGRGELLMKEFLQVKIAQAEAVIQKFQVQIPSNLYCQGNFPITRMCQNYQCKNLSLFCSEKGCQTCKQSDHQACFFITLEAVVNLINHKAKLFKRFIRNFYDQQSLTNSLYLYKLSLIQSESNRFFGEESLKTIDTIFKEKKSNNIVGKQARDFISNYTISTEKATNLLKIAQEKRELGREKVLKETKQFERRWLNTFILQTNYQSEKRIIYLDEYSLGNFILEGQKISKLLPTIGLDKNTFLYQSLNKPQSLRLLFKASEHQFKASAFHNE